MVLRDVRQEEALHHFLKQPIIRVSNSSGFKPRPSPVVTSPCPAQVLGDVAFPAANVQGQRERPEEREMFVKQGLSKNKKKQTSSSSQLCDALTWLCRRPGLPPGDRPVEQQTPTGQQREIVRPPPTADKKTVWPSVTSQRGIDVSPR